MDDEKIKTELLEENIDWIRNPATACNFGGVWERQIWSRRNIMSAPMKQHGHSLNDESLRTLLCEAEAVVNSLPLTTETLSDPHSPLPPSQSTLLTGKTKLILPPSRKVSTRRYLLQTSLEARRISGINGVENTCIFRSYS